MAFQQIPPHGGKLVNRVAQGKEREELLKKASALKKIHINAREVSDLEMTALGAFSPLEGFMNRADYEGVVKSMHLAAGLAWSIPVTLAVSDDEAKPLREKDDVALLDEANNLLGVLHLDEKYTFDKEEEAKNVYKTTDKAHPGVAYLYSTGNILLGGKVTILSLPAHDDFLQYRLSPAQTRELFKQKNWRRVVGFQTRNPVHRAHEYLIKCAMEIVDGLFLNPLVGETKKDDIPADVRMACYEKLLKGYFPQDRVVLAVLGASMRYAGPREAIFHAIIRKNFGCTHFIVGRDHAGVGNYYGTFDAHHIFDEFAPDELGITPLFFDHSFYCRKCAEMTSAKTCPHAKEDRISLSGTKVRELLAAGELPPPEFTRPEIAEILLQAYRKGAL